MNASERSGGGHLRAVRGLYSSKKLRSEGLPECNVFGDPALLMPLVYTPYVIKVESVGIIPHLSELKDVKNSFSGIKVINLNGRIERTIDEICSCRFVVSTSLHGVIIAHAYGIPALWIKRGYIYTDGIKFNDYFSSVGIPLYDGACFHMEDVVSKDYEDL